MSSTIELGERKIALSRRFAWGLGSLGTGIILNVQTIFYANYLVDYIGLSAALVGVLLFGAKLFDLVTDLPMGWISDRTKSRLGRRRPYLFIGAFLCALAFIGLFNVPQGGTQSPKVYVVCSLLFMYLAYTVFTVPYIAAPSEMTDDYHERSKIMSWRVVFAMIATTFGATLTALLIDYFGGGAPGFSRMSLVLALVIVVSCLIAFLGTPTSHAPVEKHEEAQIPLMEKLKSMKENTPFFILISAKLCQLVAFACNIGIQIFFFIQVMGVSFSTFGLLAMWKGIATVCAVVLWRILSQKIGKKITYIIAAAGWGLTTLTWLWAGPGEDMVVTAIRFVFLGIFASGQILMGLSILTDTIEYDRRRTGLRREGIFSSLYTSVEKLAFTVAPALSGIYLTYAGYQAGQGGAGDQPESAITAIYILLAIVPAILNAISIVFLFYFKLDETRLKETVAAS